MTFLQGKISFIQFPIRRKRGKKTPFASLRIREPNEIKYYSDDFIRAQLETGTGVLGPA